MAQGVGMRCEDPDAITEVIQARYAVKPDGVCRSQHAPFRIEPHLGQVSK
tara:strand:+ start:763 stop:912 length:150 start_codon:yes stop_codon:yes gene_type:complete